jgi:hypothetical protein
VLRSNTELFEYICEENNTDRNTSRGNDLARRDT